MATLQKFKLLATRCAVSESPTRSPTASPVILLRRRKTLRMFLNRSSDHRRFSRHEDSPELQQISEKSPGMESNVNRSSNNKKDKIRGRRKLKELFVSSPPFEVRAKSGRDDREGLLPSNRGGLATKPSPACRIGLSGSLRPVVSGMLRHRLLRRAWRPALLAIPEQ